VVETICSMSNRQIGALCSSTPSYSHKIASYFPLDQTTNAMLRFAASRSSRQVENDKKSAFSFRCCRQTSYYVVVPLWIYMCIYIYIYTYAKTHMTAICTHPYVGHLRETRAHICTYVAPEKHVPRPRSMSPRCSSAPCSASE
jgi:hypothetical protein